MEPAKPTPCLICMPDLTGFTRFMIENSLEVSQHVIPSILNNLIEANMLNFKVSEIEGDAILFYKTKELPSFEALAHQCRVFFNTFIIELKKLGIFIDEQIAAQTIQNLGLKIIFHYGEVSLTRIGNRVKMIGQDVIIAHRLLKNPIPYDEYALFSEKVFQYYNNVNHADTLSWAPIEYAECHYDYIGRVGFYFIDLAPLQNTVKIN